MSTDYRALCAELVELSAPTDSIPQLAERLQKLSELASRARAALAAQPEPVAPTDEELLVLAEDAWIPFAKSQPHPQGHSWDLVLARAVLARWGTPAIAAELEGQ
jgi:hypothetical protein